jgi:hypothetical protein
MAFLCRPYAAGAHSASHPYTDPLSSCSSQSTGEHSMLDLIYLALGLGLFGLMQLYARWAAKA